MLTLESLNECFKEALNRGLKYVGVRIAIGLTREEVIINPRENFEEKMAYYSHVYDENLRHKYSEDKDIRITGFAYGASFADIELDLEFYNTTGSLN